MRTSSEPPLVDIVIPVHSQTRPLQRAVESAIESAPATDPQQCRITVVAHHLSREDAAHMLPERLVSRVSIVECPPEGSTPAVPRNTALKKTTATYICFLDSDDTLDPGSVDRWLSMARQRGSDWVLPFQHHASGRPDMTPITRPLTGTRVNAVADRLFYRSSAFGLIRVETAVASGAYFDEEVLTAEEQTFILRLHTMARRIDYARGTPGLLVHSDATDRVSTAPISVREQARPALRVSAEEWFGQAPSQLQAGFILKYLRVNILPLIQKHLTGNTWDRNEAQETQAAVRALLDAAAHTRDQLSRAETTAVKLIDDLRTDPQHLTHALEAARRFATPAALLTPRVSWVLARNAPARVYTAGAVQILRYRRGRRRTRC